MALPNQILALDQKLTSGRLSSSLTRFGNYMMYDRHPTVMIFFFLLLSVSEYLYLPYAWPRMGIINQILGSIAIISPYAFLYLSAASDPGYITRENHQLQMAQYPYDFTLFYPGTSCRTCQLLKPARSKHCSVCKRCIAKADHHCIFINNCVGVGNQHWFILLLFSTAVLTFYGSAVGLSLMSTKMVARYPNWSLWLPSAKVDLVDWLMAWNWGLQDNVGCGAVTLLCALISPLVWGLLFYNLYLVYVGTTTNESMKWADWQDEVVDGLAFKRSMPRDRVKDLRFEPAWTRWPVEAEMALVRTENGQAPNPDDGHYPGVGQWTPVFKMIDVINLYDLGLWNNLRDVFWPRYRFTGGGTPMSERRGYNGSRKAKASIL